MSKSGRPKANVPPTGGTISSKAISLFPNRPKRLSPAPGTPVELITNLFKISVQQDKPIYRYTIEIDYIEVEKSGDAKKPAVPRKINRDIRVKVVKQAMTEWLKNNSPKDASPYSYVLDTNGSTMFALFDMALVTDSNNKKKLEIEVETNIPFCMKGKLVEEKKRFKIKIQDGFLLKARELLDYCSGKGVQDNERYKDHVRALNVIFFGEIVTIPRFFVAQQRTTGIGSIFPYERSNQFPISQGVICNKGFTLSVRPTEKGLVLNVANTVAPFLEPLSLVDLLARRFNVRNFSTNLAPFVRESLEKYLSLKQVEAIHLNYGTQQRPHYRTYRVQGISKKSASEEKFDCDGKMISVYEYFKREYPKVELKYPNLPCIVDKGRMVPIEVCRIVDRQRLTSKLNPEETGNVVRKAAMKPEFHFKDVQQNAQSVSQHGKSFRKFGLELDMKPIEVVGRELAQIKILGSGNYQTTTQNGEYKSSRFVKAVRVPKWAILIVIDESVTRSYRNPQEVTMDGQKFAQMYAKIGREKGVEINPTNDIRMIRTQDHKDLDLKKELTGHVTKLNSDGVVHCIVTLPNRIQDWTYSYLQYLEATCKGTRKQDQRCTRITCLKFDNYLNKIVREQQFFKASMFINNLWLKYNTKLGGVNFILDPRQNFGIQANSFTRFLDPCFLFVSIDVCHPAPGDRLKQSVAASVGMWNISNESMSSCTRIRVQRKDRSDKDKSTVEEVGELGVMFDDIIQSYRKQTNGKLPSHIVILRDGVSEGQFKMVLEKELSQVKQVLANFYSKLQVKSPLLSCLTVQKRHRVRFMRKQPVKDRRGNNDFNIQPGTVVDTDVTVPNGHSFYMAPHKAIQGTARAPHVYMIYDEIGFSQDSAQAMIFSLSYLSPRCTKGTSIPTPINLADLAAERGKNLVVSWNEANAHVRMNDNERLIKLNAFLLSVGDTNYLNTMFYI